MQPTRPPDAARRGRHEATGEWPQPPLSACLAERARTTPERVFVIEADGASHTFAAVAARAERMAAALRRLGVRQGEAVLWQLPNWMEAVALAGAIDRLGAVSVPVLPIWREQELGFACRQTGARVLVVPGVVRGVDHRDLAAAVRRSVAAIEHVLTVRAEPAGGQRALEALEDDPDTPLPPSPHGPHDVSAVFYTSGTTADPKGVLHTPSTLGAVLHSHAQRLRPGPDDRSLLQFPLTHVGGLVMFALLPARWASSAVYMDRYDPALAVELIARHGVTIAGGPPAVLQGMFDAASWSPGKVRTVRASGTGAADVSPELMRRIRTHFPAAFVYRAYGLTECPMLTCGAPDDPLDRLDGSDGRAVPGATVRIVGEAGRSVPAGVEGEIEAYGPQLCVGYADPALDEAFAGDGFFRTGDLGVMDAGGWVRITGRRKDIIIRKGENLSAKGIEDELAAHPAVAEAAVIGVPDAASGERVCACVVLRPGAGALDLAGVRAFMEARGVMRQKVPERLEVLDALPRNPTGKVTKDVLRARFGSGG